jgi:hypothetical protein
LPNSLVESQQPRDIRRQENVIRLVKEKPVREEPSNLGAVPAAKQIPYIRPQYQPLPTRESISEAMADRAPFMQPFPRSKTSHRMTLKPVWLKIKVWSANTITAARDFFSRQSARLHRLYGKLTRKSNTALEGMPSIKTLNQKSKKTSHRRISQCRWCILFWERL